MKVWQNDTLKIECLNAAEAKNYSLDFANLRINTFREYPYFYDGSLESEKAYFDQYCAVEKFRMLALFDGCKFCGMGTLVPMDCALYEIVEPFKRLSLNPADYLYFGELILEKEYRRKSLTPVFMREAAKIAQNFGLRKISYMAIASSPNDANRPADYRDANAIAAKFGFAPIENADTAFSYKSNLSKAEVTHVMKSYQADVAAILCK